MPALPKQEIVEFVFLPLFREALDRLANDMRDTPDFTVANISQIHADKVRALQAVFREVLVEKLNPASDAAKYISYADQKMTAALELQGSIDKDVSYKLLHGIFDMARALKDAKDALGLTITAVEDDPKLNAAKAFLLETGVKKHAGQVMARRATPEILLG